MERRQLEQAAVALLRHHEFAGANARAVADLLEHLAPLGFEHRFPDMADELLESGSVAPLVHTPTRMEVDLVLAGSGLEDLTLSRATRVLVEGVEVPFAQATDLVVMKVLAGRGKDLEDVHSLLASGAVDREEALDLLEQLESALDLPGLVSGLQSAIDGVD